jgi:hypothetical protein
MQLGGVVEAGAIGHNGTSPAPSSAAAIGTVAAPASNGTSTSTAIGTSATPDPNGTSTSVGISTSATTEGDVTSNSAIGNNISGSVEPHVTTFSPTAQAATSIVSH